MLALIATAALAQIPSSAGLSDFDRYCSRLDSGPEIEERLEAAGWHQFEADKRSEVARLVAAINEVPSPDFKISTHVFRASVSGPVFLVSQMTAPDGTGSIECKHIDETAAIPTSEALQTWAGIAPEMSRRNGAIVWTWKPGRFGADFTAVVYVDPKSKPRFPGVGVVTTSVRFY